MPSRQARRAAAPRTTPTRIRRRSFSILRAWPASRCAASGVRITQSLARNFSVPVPRFARALRHPNYRLFFSGQLVSLVGTWMQSVAEAWLVYRLTGSAALLGVAGFASQIPVLFLATVGGTVADRFNRHRILVITQACSMVLPLILATLVFTGRVHVWHVFTLAALLGVVNAFDVPARQSFVVEMVGKDDLVNAIALNS